MHMVDILLSYVFLNQSKIMDGINMVFNCCFCNKAILDFNQGGRLIIRKLQGVKTSQELYCHIDCLEKMLFNPQMLYIKNF